MNILLQIMRKTRTIGNQLTLMCKCGKEYTSGNPRLAHKLLALHALKVHNERITENDIDMIPGDAVNLGMGKSNPHSTKGNSNANRMNEDMKSMINWVAVC